MGELIKILVFVVLFSVLWNLARRLLSGPPAPPRQPGQPRQKRQARQPKQIEELVQCAVCASYMTADAGRCGRRDCPRR